MMTGRVDAVSKEHDCLAPRNRGQLFVKDILDCVVESRAAAGARATDGFVDHFTMSLGVSLSTKAVAAFGMSSRRNWVEPLVSINRTTLNGESVVAKYAIFCSTPFSSRRNWSRRSRGTYRPLRSITDTGTVTKAVSKRMTSPSTVSPLGLTFDSVTPLSSVLAGSVFVCLGSTVFRPDWA